MKLTRVERIIIVVAGLVMLFLMLNPPVVVHERRFEDGDWYFVKVREFGNWLRLAGEWPAGVEARVIVTLALKE